MNKKRLTISSIILLALCMVIGLATVTQVKADTFNSLTVTPQAAGSNLVYPGETAYYTVTLSGAGDHASWDLSINSGSNLPAGFVATFIPNPIKGPSGTATLAITTLASTNPDFYSFTVHCSDSWDGNPTGDSSTIALTVKPDLVVPEYPLAGLTAVFSCFGAFVVFKKRSTLPQLFHR
jgi:hypothetical protein